MRCRIDWIAGTEIQHTEDAADGSDAEGGAEWRGCGCRGGTITEVDSTREGDLIEV